MKFYRVLGKNGNGNGNSKHGNDNGFYRFSDLPFWYGTHPSTVFWLYPTLPYSCAICKFLTYQFTWGSTCMGSKACLLVQRKGQACLKTLLIISVYGFV